MITKCSGNNRNSVPELPRADILPFCILQEEKSDKVLEWSSLCSRCWLIRSCQLLLPLSYFRNVAYVGMEAMGEIFKKHLALLLAGQIIPSITALTWKQSIMLYGNKKESWGIKFIAMRKWTAGTDVQCNVSLCNTQQLCSSLVIVLPTSLQFVYVIKKPWASLVIHQHFHLIKTI